MFTIVPVPVAVDLQPGGRRRRAAVAAGRRRFLGAAAALPASAIREWAPHASLLGAVLAVALLALLTRCLHLDGLADTADGLGSGAPAARALEIMRQSDIGPFGVVALIFAVLGADVAALGSRRAGLDAGRRPGGRRRDRAGRRRPRPRRGVPAARSSGFGSLVANDVPAGAAAAWTVGVLGLGAAIASRPVDSGRLGLVPAGCRAGRRLAVAAARRPPAGRRHRRRVRRADRVWPTAVTLMGVALR